MTFKVWKGVKNEIVIDWFKKADFSKCDAETENDEMLNKIVTNQYEPESWSEFATTPFSMFIGVNDDEIVNSETSKDDIVALLLRFRPGNKNVNR